LDWAASANATSYDIYWSSDPFALWSTWSLLTNVVSNTFLDAVGPVSPATGKFYRVVARNDGKSRTSTHAIASRKAISSKVRNPHNNPVKGNLKK
jgi:hypothetical protein